MDTPGRPEYPDTQFEAWLEEMKPFECVGTFEETKTALYMAYKNKEYEEDAVMKMFEKDINN